MTERKPQRKRVCPKCKRLKVLSQFRNDKKGWCTSCRNFRAPKGSSASYEPPADDTPVLSPPTELELGSRRVVVVQRIGDVVRITSARREKRNETDSLVTGGTVLLPIENLREILREVMAAVQAGK